MKHFKYTVTLIVLTLAFSVSAQSQEVSTYKLVIHVHGFGNTDGVIRAFLFDSSENFLKEPYMSVETTIENELRSTLIFEEVPSGNYAVNSYHDKNNNNELDTNWLRMPKEPYGFSNNVRGKMGPPIFEDTLFIIDNQDRAITITLK